MDAKIEALQAVVERVAGTNESSEDGTIAAELDRALAEAGIELTDSARSALVDAIDGADDQVDVAQVVAADDVTARER